MKEDLLLTKPNQRGLATRKPKGVNMRSHPGNKHAQKAPEDKKSAKIQFVATESDKAIFVGFAKKEKMSLAKFLTLAAKEFIDNH